MVEHECGCCSNCRQVVLAFERVPEVFVPKEEAITVRVGIEHLVGPYGVGSAIVGHLHQQKALDLEVGGGQR